MKKRNDPDPGSMLAVAAVGVALVLEGACGSATTATAPGPGSVDLAVVMTASMDQTRVGETVTYAINVTNAGPAAAGPVGFTTWLTSHDDLQATTGNGWRCQPHTGNFVTCELAELAPGGSSALTMSRKAFQAGTLANTVEVDTKAQTDANLANNRATVAVRVE